MIDSAYTAKIFKATRLLNGLGQTEFSATLGITQGTVSKIESGTMSPDLGLWFKFLETYHILDPYCFNYGVVEIEPMRLTTLLAKSHALIPNYTLDDFPAFTVNKIKPLINSLEADHKKALSAFLKEKNIKSELFTILNHPIPLKLLTDLFDFMKRIKFIGKSLGDLNLDFKDTLGRKRYVPTTEVDIKDSLFTYNFQKNGYSVIPTKECLALLESTQLGSEILEYNILYPAFFHTAQSDRSLTPSIHPPKSSGDEWIVKYSN